MRARGNLIPLKEKEGFWRRSGVSLERKGTGKPGGAGVEIAARLSCIRSEKLRG
ncbi:hypothetical protein SDC9_159755 [bioreactor metagenome]|uniref:Uncharacterized protein n=1 Tax=bioreactor metagenome TaxID=1076179 RepID=A0A645FDQ2_9ZZZZ